jgi:hypothetical protein
LRLQLIWLRLIELGEEADGRAHLEAQMILNHKDAIEFLVGNADELGFNRYTILNLHAILANNLLADPTAAGRPSLAGENHRFRKRAWCRCVRPPSGFVNRLPRKRE